MTYLIVKALISGLLIAAISELAKRSPGIGALVASLPLVSILAMIWLWRDTADPLRIASLAESTFWLIAPTMPMFLVLPWLLRHGFGFWLAIGLACGLTICLYAVTIWLLPRLGIQLSL